jgi:long-chain fatty acid transport protein
MHKKIIIITGLTLICNLHALSSGYQVLLQGNRQTGNGNIGVSLLPDASSIFFNPGALGFMGDNGFLLGGNLIFAGNTFWNSEQPGSAYIANTNNPMGTPFHFYSVWGPDDQRWKAGIGVYTPYGSGVDWGNEWQGQLILRRISLRAIFFQPTLSYRINEWLGAGGGFVYSIGNVNLQKGLPLNSSTIDPSAELDGSASGMGYNLGLMIKPTPRLNIGINYRSKVMMKVQEGNVIFNVPSAVSSMFPENNSFNAQLPLPANLSMGLTFSPVEKLSLSTEANWVGWAAYDTLSFDFNKNSETVQDIHSPRNYKNSWVFKIGAELNTNNRLILRLGGYYDQTPVQKGYMTPETPDSDRIGFTAGIGYKFSDKLILDASFLYINGMERRQTYEDAIEAGTINSDKHDVLPGTYRLNAFIPGVSVSYKF